MHNVTAWKSGMWDRWADSFGCQVVALCVKTMFVMCKVKEILKFGRCGGE